jgi:AcrR family transcriptional regulator
MADQDLTIAPSGTRTNLLKTAWRLIEKRGVDNVTLSDVAAAAKVSRQAVYLHFGNRAGLLIAMTRYRDVNSTHVREMMAAAHKPDIRAGFDRFVRCWFQHVVNILPVARAIEAAALSDADARAAWEERMEDLRRAIRPLIDRLADSGQLNDGWSRDQATDWMWSRTHVDVWSQLAVDRNWKPEEVARRVAASLLTDLVRDR